jgi:hypothetical protein
VNEYRPEEHSLMPEQVPSSHSAIRGEETEQIELLNIRHETVEEYALSRPDGMREALLISTSFLLFFFCLVTPDVFVPGLPVAGLCCLRPGSGASLRRPRKTRCAKSTACAARPNAGAFGENDQEQINNISLGIIDLIYPRHWQPWIAQDLGQQSDIDIYLDRHVVRQGRFLSLHDEVKNFPSSTGCAAPSFQPERCWF